MIKNEPHSPLGVTSFFMGVICGLLATFFMFAQVTASYVFPQIPNNQGLIAAIIFILLFGNLLALILGIASFFQKNKKKLFGLMGIVFSAGMLFLNIGLLIIIDINF